MEKITYGPASPEVKQRYKQQFDRLLTMSRSEMIDFIEKNPLPREYSQWSSSIPLYFYYGLERTDALGPEVYKESLQRQPGYHLGKMFKALGTFFVNGLSTIQTFPTFADPMGYTFEAPDFSASILGRSRIVPPAAASPYFIQYYNPAQVVSYYGVRFIGMVDALTSAWPLYLALNMAALLGMFRLRSDLHKVAALALFAGLLAMVSASGILLGLRQKELISLTPVYFLFLSIGLRGAGRFLADDWPAPVKARRKKK